MHECVHELILTLVSLLFLSFFLFVSIAVCERIRNTVIKMPLNRRHLIIPYRTNMCAAIKCHNKWEWFLTKVFDHCSLLNWCHFQVYFEKKSWRKQQVAVWEFERFRTVATRCVDVRVPMRVSKWVFSPVVTWPLNRQPQIQLKNVSMKPIHICMCQRGEERNEWGEHFRHVSNSP